MEEKRFLIPSRLAMDSGSLKLAHGAQDVHFQSMKELYNTVIWSVFCMKTEQCLGLLNLGGAFAFNARFATGLSWGKTWG